MNTIQLRATVSNPRRQLYSAAYDYLNDHHFLGEVEIVNEFNGIKDDHDGYKSILTLKLPREILKYRSQNIERAIYDTTRRQCRCEHDCCGCYQTNMIDVLYKDNICEDYSLWYVRLSHYRNI